MIATRLGSALLILVTASCRTLAPRPVSLDDQRSRLERVLHEGRCRENPAECQRAIADLERFLATNPHAYAAAGVHLEVADAWEQLGARDRALAHVRAVIARPAYRFEGLLKMASLYFAAAEEEEAWKALQEAAALEAEGTRGRRRTAAQQADRAHVYFASLVV
jgi:tetratricopeptide (TPR) repeat protein